MKFSFDSDRLLRLKEAFDTHLHARQIKVQPKRILVLFSTLLIFGFRSKISIGCRSIWHKSCIHCLSDIYGISHAF